MCEFGNGRLTLKGFQLRHYFLYSLISRGSTGCNADMLIFLQPAMLDLRLGSDQVGLGCRSAKLYQVIGVSAGGAADDKH